jgi:gamma-glutamylcyclotransferase
MPRQYFAYGSNMDELAMSALCPSASCVGVACLDGFRLAFTRRSIISGTGVADVVRAPGASVWGVLYELEEADLAALDRKEGRGWAYAREEEAVRLVRGGSARRALLYTVIAKEQRHVRPSREYLARMLDAARGHAFAGDYIAMLEAVTV